MPYIFRNHTTGSNQLSNWEISAEMDKAAIQTIPDTIESGNTSKLGSSIPSPFARMYLFDTAFQMISNTGSVGLTMYHQLVSDCLDLYQFLFTYADEGHITYKKWDKKERIASLKSSNFPEHRKSLNRTTTN